MTDAHDSRQAVTDGQPDFHQLPASRIRRRTDPFGLYLPLHHPGGASLPFMSASRAHEQIKKKNDLKVLKYVNPPSAMVSDSV